MNDKFQSNNLNRNEDHVMGVKKLKCYDLNEEDKVLRKEHKRNKKSKLSSSAVKEFKGEKSIEIPNTIQYGQEHALIRIISCMYRQQANMSMEHARQLERLSQHFQNDDNIEFNPSNLLTDNPNIHRILQDLNLSRAVPLIETVEDKTYREDLLKLVKNSLENVRKINDSLDNILASDYRIETNDTDVYDAFGALIRNSTGSVNCRDCVTPSQRKNSDDDKSKSDHTIDTRKHSLKHSRSSSESSEYSRGMMERTSSKHRLRSGLTVDTGDSNSD